MMSVSSSIKKSVMMILLTIFFQLRVPAIFSPFKPLLVIIDFLNTGVTGYGIYLIIQYLKSGPPANKTVIHFLAIRFCKICLMYDVYDLIFCVLVFLFQTQLTSVYASSHFYFICAILPSHIVTFIYAYILAIVSFQANSIYS